LAKYKQDLRNVLFKQKLSFWRNKNQNRKNWTSNWKLVYSRYGLVKLSQREKTAWVTCFEQDILQFLWLIYAKLEIRGAKMRSRTRAARSKTARTELQRCSSVYNL